MDNENIQRHVAAEAQALAGLSDVKGFGYRLLLELAVKFIKDKVVNNDNFEAFVTAIEKVFDDYVVPYDLPIPDSIEPMVESAMREGIRPAVKLLFDALGA